MTVPDSGFFPPISKLRGVATLGADLLIIDPPPIWIVEELCLSKGTSYVIAGYGGSKKSLFMQYLLLHIATGKTLFNRFKCQHLRVLHIDYEQKLRITRRRYRRMANSMGIRLDQAYLVILNQPFKLSDKDAKDQLKILLDRHPCDVLAIDSLKASTPGVKENDAAISDYIRLLNDVCEERGMTLIVIHHEGKPTKDSESLSSLQRLRGHSSIGDAVDNTLRLVGSKRSVPTLVMSGKNRDEGEDSEDFGFVGKDIQIGEDPMGGLVLQFFSEEDLTKIKAQQMKNGETTIESRIRSFIVSLPDSTYSGSMSNLGNELKVRKSKLLEILDILQEKKFIVRLHSTVKWIGQ